jgi:bile acid:Na+ symporter, BASS family
MDIDMAALILLALKVGIMLTVLALGLRASPQDATFLLHRPGQLLRALLSMNVVMPLVAVAMVAAFHLHPAVEVALVTLAVSPIPPLLPRKAMKTGAAASYTISLLVTAAVFSIVFVPLAVDLLGLTLGRPAQMSPAAVAPIVAITILLPLTAGLLVRRLARAFAERIAKPVSVVAAVLVLGSVVPVLFTTMPAMASLIGNGTLIAIATCIVAGFASGHLLGGPEPADRTVLALVTSSRHPGVALAIASANFPEQKLVLAAIFLYLLMNAVLWIPYRAWSKSRHAKVADESLSS